MPSLNIKHIETPHEVSNSTQLVSPDDNFTYQTSSVLLKHKQNIITVALLAKVPIQFVIHHYFKDSLFYV